MIEEIQKKIDETRYWDLIVLDVQTKYFGDEVYIFIEDDEFFCWKISFHSCYKVDYETDANWRGDFFVKNMRNGQLGYTGQDISLKRFEDSEEFIECYADLSIMTMNIVCKDIHVEKVKRKNVLFFWEDK